MAANDTTAAVDSPTARTNDALAAPVRKEGSAAVQSTIPSSFSREDISSLAGTPTQPSRPLTPTGREVVYLDGNSLNPETLVQLASGKLKIDLTEEAWEYVDAARKVVDSKVESDEVCYGINTGFGNFATTVISTDQLHTLQENLIRSHASGLGDGLPPFRVRMLLALRINVLAKGYSGIGRETLQRVIAAFNESCLPYVPEKGTVGASGDLAPLSHLALGMMGEGQMWDEISGWGEASVRLAEHGLVPIDLKAKEGLALINGTQMITALGAEAVHRARIVADTATVVAALTLDTLKGTPKAFDKGIHGARPHAGQMKVAQNLRALLHTPSHPSELYLSHESCGRVQDAYTLRCIPQVHGITHDTIDFVYNIIHTEMNSATDNPMIFARRDQIISGGNFHGEYPAKALDYLAIGIHEISAISERRIERLTNTATNGVLPPFLVENGGLNSGFMIAHCAAASLVSENKVLCHPASVDSLPTSANKEDHVSMGGFAARKALTVVDHVEQVVAIELLAACQALDLMRPLTTTEPLERVHALVRTVVDPWDKDRYMAPDIEAVSSLVRTGAILATVKDHLAYYADE